jgi:hypothetical protein
MTKAAARSMNSQNVRPFALRRALFVAAETGWRRVLRNARGRQLRLLNVFSAGLLASILLLTPTAPADASIGDCIAAAVPVTQTGELADLTSQVAACSTAAVGDPVEAVVVATIVALVASGTLPADTQQCDEVIDSVIAQFVAQALNAAGLGNAFGQDLTSLANGAGGLAAVPVLGEMISCGCTIAGAPDEVKQIAEQYFSKVEGCADFFKDAGKTALNWMEDGVCDVLSIFGGCSPAGGGSDICDMDTSCTNADCPPGGNLPGPKFSGPAFSECSQPGYQCNACGFYNQCKQIPNAVGVIPGRCTCAPPYTGEYYNTGTDYYGGSNSAQILYKCVCNSPNIVTPSGQCSCPSHQKLSGGICVPCADNEVYSNYSCSVCPGGEKPDAKHETCVPACDASKGEYFNAGAKTCEVCPAGANVNYFGEKGGLGECVPACQSGQVAVIVGAWNPAVPLSSSACYTCAPDNKAVYDNPQGSAGNCVKCPDGTSSPAGSTKCTPLDCGPAGYVDPDHPNACKSCPAGKFVGELGPLKGPLGSASPCKCPDIAKPEGDACVCPNGALAGNSVIPCRCPAGGNVDPKTFSCVCPSGTQLSPLGWECISTQLTRPGLITPVVPPPHTIVIQKPGPVEVPGVETPAKVAPASPPRPGVAKPPAPASQPRPSVTPPAVSPQVVPPPHQIVCPPGMVPGPFGQRCFPGRPAPGTAQPGHRIVCPPGFAPGPFGMRCFPIRR